MKTTIARRQNDDEAISALTRAVWDLGKGRIPANITGLEGLCPGKAALAEAVNGLIDSRREGRVPFRPLSGAGRTGQGDGDPEEGGEKSENRYKREFISTMSHEMRTPLNAVIGMSELVMDTVLSVDQQEMIRVIRKESEDLLRIIDNIFDYSAIRSKELILERIPFDLKVTVAGVAENLGLEARKKGLPVSVELPGELPRIMGDPGRVRQVLMNLVGNSIKFTERGEIKLRVEVVEEEERRVRCRFCVSDTGIGIPREKRALIFEGFSQGDGGSTRRYGGVGLGVTLARKFVEEMGGAMEMESREGVGTTFRFTLWFPKAGDRVPGREPGRGSLEGQRVLIVDPHGNNCYILSEYLKQLGCTPSRVSSGAGALKKLGEAFGEGRPFALVVTDYKLTDMNGFMLARGIRERGEIAECPIILLASMGRVGDGKECRAAGIDGYFTRPIRREDLKIAMETVVADGGGRKERGLVTRHTLAEAGGGKNRVLIADDYPINRTVLAAALRDAGHHVDFAVNGLLAVEAFRKKDYDLILMDIQMPEMDGFHAADQIRRIEARRRKELSHESAAGTQGVPIVAVTADAGIPREGYLRAGMNDMITKPFTRRDILGIAERWIGMGKSSGDPFGENTSGKSAGEKPSVDPFGEKFSGKSVGEKSSGDSFGEKSSGDPVGVKCFGRPTDGRSEREASSPSVGGRERGNLGTPVDWDRALSEFLGKRELLMEVLVFFQKSLGEQITKSMRALEQGDFAVIKAEAHTLKGGAGNIAADGISETAKSLEEAAEAGDRQGIAERLESLAGELEGFSIWLTNLS